MYDSDIGMFGGIILPLVIDHIKGPMDSLLYADMLNDILILLLRGNCLADYLV